MGVMVHSLFFGYRRIYIISRMAALFYGSPGSDAEASNLPSGRRLVAEIRVRKGLASPSMTES